MCKRVLAMLITTGAAVAMAGCAKPTNILSQLLVQPQTAGDLGYGIQWQRGLGLGRGKRVLYVELLGDRIATLESDNVLSVLRADNGDILWREQVGQPIERFSKPVRAGDMLVICSESRAYLYDLQFGDLLQAIDLAYGSSTTPAISNGLMIHGSPTGIIFAHTMDLGTVRWTFGTGAAVTNNPMLVGSVLLVTNAAGDLYALDPADGNLLWHRQAHQRIAAKLAVDERRVYAASEDQSLYAFFTTSGRPAWRFYGRHRLTRDPAAMAGLVLLPEPQEALLALDPERNGQVVWARPDLVEARPLFASERGLHLHHANRGEIVILSPANGRTIERVPIPAVHHVIVDAAGPPNLYMVRGTGRIMKLTPK